jgi:xanthine dehydrogenase accessory factor
VTETHTLIQAYQQARAEYTRAALATVVRVEGSAYRRPGARMLVTESGGATGLISGGCLDSDVRQHAARVMRTGRPVIVKYDTTSNDDLVWSLGLGCSGIVHVLIEPASAETDDLMRFLDTCSTGQARGACATVIRSERFEVPIGRRAFLYPDGAAALDVEASAAPIAPDIFTDLRNAVRSGVSSVSQYGVNDEVEAFVEVVEPRVPLFIFGAGPDVLPLVVIAADLGWHTTVVDTQARAASLERFAQADAVILCRPAEADTRVLLSESAVAVLMTHNYLHDMELLPLVLNSRARYVGCLGSRRRTERLMSILPDTPATADQRHAGGLRAPIGLDIGAETSSEIALSIAAEILSAIRSQSGGPLSRRPGPIHGGDAAEIAREAVGA